MRQEAVAPHGVDEHTSPGDDRGRERLCCVRLGLVRSDGALIGDPQIELTMAPRSAPA